MNDSAVKGGEQDLAGEWGYRLDPADRGIDDRWFEAGALRPEDGTITFPGTLTTNGVGEVVTARTSWTGRMADEATFLDPKWERLSGDQYKPPYWLCPERYYSGVAWYQRDVDIPVEWNGSRPMLVLERPHWRTTVWLDETELGSCDALSTPHRYLLPRDMAPGRHRLTIRMDNRYLVKIGMQAHSISDNTNGNWNGVVGTLALSPEPAVRLAGPVITAEPELRRVAVRACVVNDTATVWNGRIVARAVALNSPRRHELPERAAPLTVQPGEATTEFDLELTDGYLTWSEWDPALYELELSLVETDARGSASVPVHQVSTTFGIRTLETDGTTFRINGRPLFLRGTLECNIFPREGYTSTSEDAWEYVYHRAQEYGFNHFRFHSWCPPEAAFRVADRMGIYLQVESCCWAAHETQIGDGLPVDRFLFEESERIVAEYGNHPSFCFLNYGNEGDGKHNAAFLTTFVEHWKTADPRRLYTSASGWPQSPKSDYHSALRARAQKYCSDGVSRYHINENPPGTDFDFAEDVAAFDRPLVSHEPGMWCVYPNFDEIAKYTGAYKARNLELYRSELEEHHMLDQWRDFLMASGKLQTICYKAEIEAMLRTPGLGGFQLLSLMDFPGQGTAMMAPVDVFYEEKGYTDACEWRRFLGETVVLARIPSLVVTTADRVEARLETFHYGRKALRERRMVWTVCDEAGTVLRSGTLGPRDVPVGNGNAYGELSFSAADFRAPGRYTLTVILAGTTATNAWEFFVFPAVEARASEQLADTTARIHESSRLDRAARRVLEDGGTVLLNTYRMLPQRNRVVTGFTPVYWNTLCFEAQPIHTMGMLCDPRHPVFGGFPTQFHTNYQWWDMLTRGEAHVLDGSPSSLRPLVQMIDSYHSNRRLGLVTEMRALGGRLVLNGIDLEHELDGRPGARQFRESLLTYLAGSECSPAVEVGEDFLTSLLEEDGR